MDSRRRILESIEGEYRRYKTLGEGAIEQVPGNRLSEAAGTAGNSIATLVRHLSGNLESRFTDFLGSDGEKPWRDRDGEFQHRSASRADLLEKWERGWAVLFRSLNALDDEDLHGTVTIRGVPLSVLEALHRSLTHASYHVGQVVLLAKTLCGESWRYLSIPPGRTAAYRENPIAERPPESPGLQSGPAQTPTGPERVVPVTIREERPEDLSAIRAVNEAAFGGPEEARLVDRLRTNDALLLSLVAVIADSIVAHVAYSPVRLESPDGDVDGAGLGPMAVRPEFQRRGIGSKLVSVGTTRLRARACPFVVVLGHPGYYPRFGFVPASRYGVRSTWSAPDNAFLVLALDPPRLTGRSGVARYRDEFQGVE